MYWTAAAGVLCNIRVTVSNKLIYTVLQHSSHRYQANEHHKNTNIITGAFQEQYDALAIFSCQMAQKSPKMPEIARHKILELHNSA